MVYGATLWSLLLNKLLVNQGNPSLSSNFSGKRSLYSTGTGSTKGVFKYPQRTPHSGHFCTFIDFFFSSHLLKQKQHRNNSFSQNLNSIDCLRKAIGTVSLGATGQWYACLLCPGFNSQHWRGEWDKNKTTIQNLKHCFFTALKLL